MLVMREPARRIGNLRHGAAGVIDELDEADLRAAPHHAVVLGVRREILVAVDLEREPHSRRERLGVGRQGHEALVQTAQHAHLPWDAADQQRDRRSRR
jgi:hypothetical protein